MGENDRPEALDWTKAFDKAGARKLAAEPPGPLPEPSGRPAESPTDASDPNTIYCLKCKTRTETTNLEQITLYNGRPAVKGLCVVCGTHAFGMGARKS